MECWKDFCHPCRQPRVTMYVRVLTALIAVPTLRDERGGTSATLKLMRQFHIFFLNTRRDLVVGFGATGE